MPELDADTGVWLVLQTDTVSLATGLIPFAGIAFLGFIAVVRGRIGHLEEQLVWTLFFACGLLYLAMLFTASALFGGLLHIGKQHAELPVNTGLCATSRAVIYQIIHEYAIRMVGMIMLVLGTIWFRTAIMPRWLVMLTNLFAPVLLLRISYSEWITMVFPAWVFLISAFILTVNYRVSTN